MTLKDYSFYLSRYSSCHRLCAKVRQTCSFSLTSVYHLPTIWSNRLNFALLSRQSAASLWLALTHRRKIKIKRNPGSSFFLNYILPAILNYSVRLFGNILNISCSHLQISMPQQPLNCKWIAWPGGNSRSSSSKRIETCSFWSWDTCSFHKLWKSWSYQLETVIQRHRQGFKLCWRWNLEDWKWINPAMGCATKRATNRCHCGTVAVRSRYGQHHKSLFDNH